MLDRTMTETSGACRRRKTRERFSAAMAVVGIRAEPVALRTQHTASLRAMRRRWSGILKDVPGADVIAAARALERQAAQNVKWRGYEMVRFHRSGFAAVTEADVTDFASRIASWYATDAFGTILAGPLWAWEQIGDGLIDA